MKTSRHYLPSGQFTLIVLSAALSGGLILAAYELTKPSSANSAGEVAIATQQNEQTQDWQAMLRNIQAQNSAYTLPPKPSETAVQDLLGAAQTDNITASVGRSLLIGLSSAKAQGLGDDIPTQDKLVASAAQQIAQDRGAPTYNATQVKTIPTTPEALKAYGNDVMAVVGAHSRANYYNTLLTIGTATDKQDNSQLNALKTIGLEYSALAKDLIALPVPQTLAPLHLQIVNNFARIAKTYPDMQLLLTDPLRGLAGLQVYESLMDETGRVFTNTAQQLASNGILFTKDEPGQAWSALLP